MPLHFDRRALLRAGTASAVLAALPLRTSAQDAIPPAPGVEVYANPQVGQMALSPSGARVAIVTQSGDTRLLIHFEIADPKPVKIPLGPDKIRDLFWADESHLVVIDSVTTRLDDGSAAFMKKGEWFQARLIDLATLNFTTLFQAGPHDPGGEFFPIVVGNVDRIKTPEGYRITAANVSMQDNGSLHLYAFDPANGEKTLLDRWETDTRSWAMTPEGTFVARADFSNDNVWTLLFNTAAAGEAPKWKKAVTVKVDKGGDYPDLLGLGRDGKGAVVRVTNDDGASVYYEVTSEGVMGEPLDPEGAAFHHAPLFHPTTRRLAGFSRHDDWFTYDYFDPLLKKLHEAMTAEFDVSYRLVPFSHADDARKMVIYAESPVDSGTYYFADFSEGNVTQLIENYPALPADWLSEKQAVTYKAADGLDIHAYLTLPPRKDAKNLPLIVLPHGGPEARDYIDFDWQAQNLAARGYAVLQPNFRGSGGCGLDFAKAGYGEWGRKMQTDLSDGVRWLVGKGTIDPKRVAILGASYGGYAALAGATLDAGIYRCAVSIAGPADLNEMLFFETQRFGLASYTVKYWKKLMGDPSRLNEISPAKQAAKAYCPILLIHGTDDTVVPITQSQMMEKALKAAGKPVEFVTYPGQDHWETMGKSRIDMMKAAMAFLDKYNPA